MGFINELIELLFKLMQMHIKLNFAIELRFFFDLFLKLFDLLCQALDLLYVLELIFYTHCGTDRDDSCRLQLYFCNDTHFSRRRVTLNGFWLNMLTRRLWCLSRLVSNDIISNTRQQLLNQMGI